MGCSHGRSFQRAIRLTEAVLCSFLFHFNWGRGRILQITRKIDDESASTTGFAVEFDGGAVAFDNSFDDR